MTIMAVRLSDPRLRDLDMFLRGLESTGKAHRTSSLQQNRFCNALLEADRAMAIVAAMEQAPATNDARLVAAQEHIADLTQKLADAVAAHQTLTEEHAALTQKTTDLAVEIGRLKDAEQARKDAQVAPARPVPSNRGGR